MSLVLSFFRSVCTSIDWYPPCTSEVDATAADTDHGMRTFTKCLSNVVCMASIHQMSGFNSSKYKLRVLLS